MRLGRACYTRSLISGRVQNRAADASSNAARAISSEASLCVTVAGVDRGLVERAKQADAHRRELYQRPISAEGVRKALGVGAGRSRIPTRVVRSEWRGPSPGYGVGFLTQLLLCRSIKAVGVG